MAKSETTSKRVGKLASWALRNPKTPKHIKSIAASALTQRPDRRKKK